MLPGVSEGRGRTDAFIARPDNTGRMDVTTIGPGFDLRLRHVDLLTISRDKTSGDFRFAVVMADRGTVRQDQKIKRVFDKQERDIGAWCAACDDPLVSPEERENCEHCQGTGVVLEKVAQ